MAECGKGCMPECKYFTTGGCISPFNCLYKIEEISAKSAISDSDAFVKGLIAENAALRERLERAIELPVKVGDTVYLLSQTSRCSAGEIVEAKIIDFTGWKDGYRFTADGEEDWFSFLRGDIGIWVFTTRAAAEARLAELKGEKNDR